VRNALNTAARTKREESTDQEYAGRRVREYVRAKKERPNPGRA